MISNFRRLSSNIKHNTYVIVLLQKIGLSLSTTPVTIFTSTKKLLSSQLFEIGTSKQPQQKISFQVLVIITNEFFLSRLMIIWRISYNLNLQSARCFRSIQRRWFPIFLKSRHSNDLMSYIDAKKYKQLLTSTYYSWNTSNWLGRRHLD